MISRSTLRMIALAIAGIVIAAAVAVFASQLASRQIGLASEPVSAGDELAPAVVRPNHERNVEGEKQGERGSGRGTAAPSIGKSRTTSPAGGGEAPPATEAPTGAESPTAPESSNAGDDSSERSGGERSDRSSSGGGHGDD